MFCEVLSSSFRELFRQNQMSTCQGPELVTPAFWVRLYILISKISRVSAVPRRGWEAALSPTGFQKETASHQTSS